METHINISKILPTTLIMLYIYTEYQLTIVVNNETQWNENKSSEMEKVKIYNNRIYSLS